MSRGDLLVGLTPNHNISSTFSLTSRLAIVQQNTQIEVWTTLVRARGGISLGPYDLPQLSPPAELKTPIGVTAPIMSSVARRNSLVKVVVAFVGLSVLAYLFASTLSNVSSQPYMVPAGALEGWPVELDRRSGSDGFLLSLRPPPELAMGLFNQVFRRTMESYAAPANPAIALVSRREYNEALAEVVGPDELVELAERHGLAAVTLDPQCMAVHRTSGGREQRLFFMLFDLPAFGRFREAVVELVIAQGGERGGDGKGFDPAALAPALLIAVSDARLLGKQVPQEQLRLDCEAPVQLADQN